MALPVDKSRWADVGAVITDPSSGQRDTGWTFQQNPPAGVFNSWMNNIYLHVQYLRNIVTEQLNWTNYHTFTNTGSVNPPITSTGRDNASAPGKGGVFTGGAANDALGRGGRGIDITGGANTSSGGGGHGASIIGGAGTSGSGGNAVEATGGTCAAGSGGTGIVATGGAGSTFNGFGVTATGGGGLAGTAALKGTGNTHATLPGYGGTATGGVATDAAAVSATGFEAFGGAKSGTGYSGSGLVGRAGDSEQYTGHGGYFIGGDTTSGATGVVRAALRVFGGNRYTDGTKTTRVSGLGSNEFTESLEPGLALSGGDTVPMHGLHVKNNGTANPRLLGSEGVRLDGGYPVRFGTDTLGVGSTNFATASGAFYPINLAYVVGRITVNSGVVTVNGDHCNIFSAFVSGTQTLRILFNQPFADTNFVTQVTCYTVTGNIIVPEANINVSANQLDLLFWDVIGNVRRTLTTTSQIINICCFGRPA